MRVVRSIAMPPILLVLFLSSHLLLIIIINFSSLVPTVAKHAVSHWIWLAWQLPALCLSASPVPCQLPLVLLVLTVLLLLGSQAADCWGNRSSVWGKQERWDQSPNKNRLRNGLPMRPGHPHTSFASLKPSTPQRRDMGMEEWASAQVPLF